MIVLFSARRRRRVGTWCCGIAARAGRIIGIRKEQLNTKICGKNPAFSIFVCLVKLALCQH